MYVRYLLSLRKNVGRPPLAGPVGKL